nr:MAG TPA: hypothetical protein [Caudoviricetes sp.]
MLIMRHIIFTPINTLFITNRSVLSITSFLCKAME